jgi:hypothetical protein
LSSGRFIAVLAVTLFAGDSDRHQLPEYDVTFAADREVFKLTGFTSPSGSIGRYIDPSSVRCDTRERNWSPPPRRRLSARRRATAGIRSNVGRPLIG